MKSWHETLEDTQSNRTVALRLMAFVLASIIMHSALLLLEKPPVIDLGTERGLTIHIVERQQQQPGEKAKASKRPKAIPEIVPIPRADTNSAPVQGVAVRDEPDTLHQAVEKRLTAEDPASKSKALDQATLQASIKGSLKQELARHFNYPLLARKRGWQGEVVLAFRVEADGRIINARVARSSGYGLLDRAALTALGKIARIQAGAVHAFAMQLPVIYRLEG